MGALVHLRSLPSAQPEAHPRGHLEARLFTPPLRELTPETSYGFDVARFAREVLEEPLDPWEEWLVIHGGELLPDGRPRFRQVLVLVARQNGKTHLCKVLALYWLFVEEWPLILGMSTNIDYAKESWQKAVDMAEAIPELDAEIGKSRGDKGIKYAAGMQEMATRAKCRYKIAASNSRGGRSLSVDRIIMDELREQHDWTAYNAAIPTMNARPHGQAWFITNQGDSTSLVLNGLHKSAMQFIKTGEGDHRLGLFEWSAPDGCDLMDEEAWAAANPNLGNRLDYDTIRSAAIRARDNGGAEETGFRTEILCQRVDTLNAAINPQAWDDGATEFTMPKDRRVGFVDISGNGVRASFGIARLTPGGKVQVAIVKDWDTPEKRRRMWPELRKLTGEWGIRKLGHLPFGPIAEATPELQKNSRNRWPAALEIVRLTGEDVPAMCMGFARAVSVGEIEHLGQELLDVQAKAAAKKESGGRWVFDLFKDFPVDALNAAAGAAYLAQMMKPPVGPVRLIGPDD